MDFWKQLKCKDTQLLEFHKQSQCGTEVLTVSIAPLLLIAYVLSLRRWRSRNRFLHWFLRIFDAISDSMLTYIIGIMQQATSASAIFSIWAILLLILQDSYNNDFDRSKVDLLKRRLADFMNYLFAGILNLTLSMVPLYGAQS